MLTRAGLGREGCRNSVHILHRLSVFKGGGGEERRGKDEVGKGREGKGKVAQVMGQVKETTTTRGGAPLPGSQLRGGRYLVALPIYLSINHNPYLCLCLVR